MNFTLYVLCVYNDNGSVQTLCKQRANACYAKCLHRSIVIINQQYTKGEIHFINDMWHPTCRINGVICVGGKYWQDLSHGGSFWRYYSFFFNKVMKVLFFALGKFLWRMQYRKKMWKLPQCKMSMFTVSMILDTLLTLYLNDIYDMWHPSCLISMICEILPALYLRGQPFCLCWKQ